MLQLISSGLGAHRKGSETRAAQAGVRQTLNLLVSELRSAAPPPLTAPVPLSPVFWPDVWGGEQAPGQWSHPHYSRVEQTDEHGVDWDRATNRLLYVRYHKGQEDVPSNDPLRDYRLVELFVPWERPNTLVRRVHRLDRDTSLFTRTTVKGADGGQRAAWQVPPDVVEGLVGDGADDVIFEAGPEAQLAFRVSHRVFEPFQDPGRTRFPQLFDPALFQVQVAVGIGSRSSDLEPWPSAESWETYREDVTEVRLPAVRSNS